MDVQATWNVAPDFILSCWVSTTNQFKYHIIYHQKYHWKKKFCIFYLNGWSRQFYSIKKIKGISTNIPAFNLRYLFKIAVLCNSCSCNISLYNTFEHYFENVLKIHHLVVIIIEG